MAFVSLVLGGSFFQLWSLHRDQQEIKNRMTVLRAKNLKIESQIQRADDPGFLELEAQNQFDLAGEGDLIFMFSDDNERSAR